MSKSPDAGRLSRGIAGLIIIIGLLVAMLLLVSRTQHAIRHRVLKEHPEEALTTAIGTLPYRPIAARLSGAFGAYSPHRTNRGADSNEEATQLSLRVAAAATIAGASADPPSHRVSGVAHLLVSETGAAIAALQLATRSRPDADTYGDLAAAYLAKAEEPGEFDANVDALAAANRALEIDSRHAAARFNRALALERLGLLAESRAAWRLAADCDRTSRWGIEAASGEKRLARLPTRSWRPEALGDALERKDDQAVRDLVKEFSREVRSWGESVYLTNWADAVERGDDAEAQRQIESSAAIGRLLARDFHEQFLNETVATTMNARGSARSTLARAFIRYRSGRIAFSKANPSVAETELREAENLFAAAGSPMKYVARYYVGSVLHDQGRFNEALQILNDVAAKVAPHPGYRALNAQIGWERGLCLAVAGDLSRAIGVYERSLEGFTALGDTESRATIEQFLAEAFEEVGDTNRAWLMRSEVMTEFSRRELSQRKIVALTAAADLAISKQAWNCACAILDLAIDEASRKSPELAAQCLSRRALANARLGRERQSRRDLEEASRFAAHVNDALYRGLLQIDALVAEAVLDSAIAPAEAERKLGEVTELLKRRGAIQSLAGIYLERTRAARRLHDDQAAKAFIDRCLEILEDRRRSLDDLNHRALILGSSREAFDEAIALALNTGRSVDAFDLAERSRGRALLDTLERRASRGEEARPLSVAELRRVLAPKAAVVVYTALPDRLLIDVVRGDSFWSLSQPVSRYSAGQIAADCSTTLRRTGSANAGAACVTAYRTFIEPFLPRIGGIEHLAFVPDASFGALPLASLQSIKPFGSIASISEAPSATLLVACARRAQALQGERGATLVIGATQFDRGAFPAAEPLQWVNAEADAVAGIHRHANRLLGAQATKAHVLAECAKAGTIHFAGHAITSGGRLQQSKLLLAPSLDGNSVDALEISRLSLPRVRAVYLSACASGRASGRADGVDNVALGFLAAGVPAVVATSWNIDDDAAPVAAEKFHRLLAAGTDPVAAATQAFKTTGAPPGMIVIGGSADLIRNPD